MNPRFHVAGKPWFLVFLILSGLFLVACGGGGGGGVSTPPVPPIAAPSNLVAVTESSTAINLTWNDNSSDELGFRVYRGTVISNVTTLVVTLGAGSTGYTNVGLNPSTTYYYRVTAFKTGEESTASNIANATTGPPPLTVPAAPSNLVATAASSFIVNLTWVDNSNNEVGFRVFRGTGPSPASFTQIGADLGEGTTAFTDTTVTGNTVYTYRVVAFNSAGESGFASAAVTTPAPPPAPVVPSSVEGGNRHSLVLMSNGTVRSWGNNQEGSLGVGPSIDNSLVPVQVVGLTGVSAISAGDDHSLALMTNGKLKGWGQNFFGAVGSGDNVVHYTPTDVFDFGTVSAVSAGGFFTVALRTDGTVWAWGSGEFGQIGDGAMTTRYTPVQVTGVPGVVTAISASQDHTLVRRNDGTVWAWGRNHVGQIGDNTTTNRPSPVQVLGLAGVSAVSAGEAHSLALMNDGTVRAWGGNSSGELGDGTTTQRLVPVQVSGLNGVSAVSAGGFFSLALRNDGTVWAWGNGANGKLGNNTTVNSPVPVQVSVLDNVVGISAAKNHSLALRNDTVWAWGFNGFGQLGDNTTINRLIPVQITGF